MMPKILYFFHLNLASRLQNISLLRDHHRKSIYLREMKIVYQKLYKLQARKNVFENKNYSIMFIKSPEQKDGLYAYIRSLK